MIVLGINAFGHDAAAVLLIDGEPVFAASEERFDRVRLFIAEDFHFPTRLAVIILALNEGGRDRHVHQVV